MHTIDIPVHIIAARDDEILKPSPNAEYYAKHIPKAERMLLPSGGHFVFLSECTVLGKAMALFIKFDVCGIKSSTDRSSVHTTVGAQALSFFEASLSEANE